MLHLQVTHDPADSPRRRAGDAAASSLRSLVRRQELFARRVHEPRVDRSGLLDSRACWFGIGVSGWGPSEGLPVDVVGLLYALEMVRRDQGHEVSWILVADANATASGVSSLAVERTTARVVGTMRTVIATLGFPVGVLRASELAPRSELDRLVEPVASTNPYVRREIAQTEAMRRRGVGLKLGWSARAMRWDERFFDDAYTRCYQGASFVYAIGGRTLDPRRPRACPYVCADRASRVLLERGEDVEKKLAVADAAAARGYRRLLDKLARAHRHLTGDEMGCGEALAQRLIDVL